MSVLLYYRIPAEGRLNPFREGYEPVRMTEEAAGFDLRSPEKVSLRPGATHRLGLGIGISFPPSWVGLILPRSGLGSKGLVFTNTVGVIDSDYRGELQLSLRNTGEETIDIAIADRVAQLVIVPTFVVGAATSAFGEYEGKFEDWVNTQRGVNGFGSTGVA